MSKGAPPLQAFLYQSGDSALTAQAWERLTDGSAKICNKVFAPETHKNLSINLLSLAKKTAGSGGSEPPSGSEAGVATEDRRARRLRHGHPHASGRGLCGWWQETGTRSGRLLTAYATDLRAHTRRQTASCSVYAGSSGSCRLSCRLRGQAVRGCVSLLRQNGRSERECSGNLSRR